MEMRKETVSRQDKNNNLRDEILLHITEGGVLYIINTITLRWKDKVSAYKASVFS